LKRILRGLLRLHLHQPAGLWAVLAGLKSEGQNMGTLIALVEKKRGGAR